MQNTMRLKIAYSMAIGYILLSLFFLDWAFNMVPFVKNTPIIKIMIDTAYIFYLFIIGVVFLVLTFLVSKQNHNAPKMVYLCFWLGFPVGVILSTIALYNNKHIGLESTIYNILMNVLFYIPAIVLYLNIKSVFRESIKRP